MGMGVVVKEITLGIQNVADIIKFENFVGSCLIARVTRFKCDPKFI